MKPKAFLAVVFALTLAAILAGIAFSHQRQAAAHSPLTVRTFQVHGEIRSLDIANKTIRIAHEEIPGYMAAMTMPLPACA